MTTIFSRIIAGEIPGTFIHRDDRCVAFMSINPAGTWTRAGRAGRRGRPLDRRAGRSLAHLFDVTHRIGRAQKRAFDCERVGVIIAGYEVPHAHIHVIPTDSMRQLSFENAAASVDPAELESAAAAIMAAMD
jgi:diadenosine tetraphosphate (Ap4A) HIT family hydrolase